MSESSYSEFNDEYIHASEDFTQDSENSDSDFEEQEFPQGMPPEAKIFKILGMVNLPYKITRNMERVFDMVYAVFRVNDVLKEDFIGFEVVNEDDEEGPHKRIYLFWIDRSYPDYTGEHPTISYRFIHVYNEEMLEATKTTNEIKEMQGGLTYYGG